MADFGISSNISKISPDSILVVTAKGVDEKWLLEDINIVTSNNLRITPIIIDFSYSLATVVEYTLDGGTIWIALNNGGAVSGGQSRFIRVRNGDQLNFRAKISGDLNRAIIGEP